MNKWIIPMLLILTFIVAGFSIVKAHSLDKTDSGIANTQSVESETYGCGPEGCDFDCTAENNCGVPSCEAVNGRGGCGCGR